MAAKPRVTKRKQFTLDVGVLQTLEVMARDRDRSLDALADEAFRHLFKKDRRPTSLKEALRASVRTVPANDRAPKTTQAKS